MNHHNTTQESGQLLMSFEAVACSQQDKILSIFKRLNVPMTWSDVSKIVGFPEISVKRSLTNLKTSGILEKTDIKGTSMYGRPSYYYKLKQ
jgi:predicted ArsR family transcriptional regulator